MEIPHSLLRFIRQGIIGRVDILSGIIIESWWIAATTIPLFSRTSSFREVSHSTIGGSRCEKKCTCRSIHLEHHSQRKRHPLGSSVGNAYTVQMSTFKRILTAPARFQQTWLFRTAIEAVRAYFSPLTLLAALVRKQPHH